MIELMHADEWLKVLKDIHESEKFKQLMTAVEKAYNSSEVFPPKDYIFRAFELTDYSQVKVVIIGQDPYHDNGQAQGLAFSVWDGIKLPPSLKNIYKELAQDLGLPIYENGNLEKWAKEGVLLMNAFLTVEAHKAGSHQKIGWDWYTDSVIEALNQRSKPCVFLLWGNFAKKKAPMISNHHPVLLGVHPSPLSASRGFFGSRPFSQINHILNDLGVSPIDWSLNEPEQLQLF